jgi:8-oxo-dGTP diphosphatase
LSMTGPALWFGAHVGVGYRGRPYRPHLPHPAKAWLWALSSVTQICTPTNPAGAEQVQDVLMLPFPEASALLASTHTWYPAVLERALAHLPGGFTPDRSAR